MNKMKIKIFTLLGLIITFSLALSSCDSLWDDLGTVTITYVSEKGTAPETKTVEQGYKLTAEDLPVLTETGYNFKGWDKVVGDEITSDTTITASWIKTWTITYNSNNGTGTMEPQIFEENVPQALSENKFTREGYTFAGWATKADASTAEYADKANFTATKNITLYAIWTLIPPAPVPSKYTITYVSAYGTKPANKEVDKGYKLTSSDLPDLGETEDKYFDKWDKTVGTEITADTTIAAAWEGIVYFDKSKITSYKNTAEKIIFTTDTYSGTGNETFNCASGSNPEYFTGVVTDGATTGLKVITIYGNGHRIYAPVDCKQLFMAFSIASSIEFNNFYTSKVTDMTQMFYNCNALTSLDLSSFDTSAVTDMNQMFNNCSALTSLDLSSFDTSAVTNMMGMFASCKALTSLNVSSFDTSAVTNMTGMFSSLENITELNLSNFDTSKVETMVSLFLSCKKLTNLNISSFTTTAVKNMSNMFSNCNSLKSLDLSKFDTSSVTNMSKMFTSCFNLEELNLSSFDTSAVTTMNQMFSCSDFNSSKLKKIIFSNKFKTNEVTDMVDMFKSCCSLESLDLSSFTKEKLTSVANMFNHCTNLKTIYASPSFDISSLTTSNTSLFEADTNLVGGKGTTCDGTNNINNAYARIDGGTENPGYFTLKQ